MSTDGSAYYQHSRSVPLASRLSELIRRRMYHLFEQAFQLGPDTAVLDVGVTCDSTQPESNFFEQLYPYPSRLVCVGTEDGSHLEKQYPGLRFIQVFPGQPLPFGDGEFDIVFSNAVVEHVGDRAGQKSFVHEICRVGKAFFITTPDRWFPVEHHTGLPFLHYLPAPMFRRVIAGTRYRYWSDEFNLNILTKSELRQLFPAGVNPQIVSTRILGVPSNIIAYGQSKPSPFYSTPARTGVSSQHS